jgi:hypothetical protein
LGLGYLGLNAAVENEASNAVARRLGFTLEGTMRSSFVDGPNGDPTAPRGDANWWGLRPGELMVPAGAALAAPGGAPGAHGVDGRTFGSVVSNAAQTDVGWLVTHVSGGRA